MGGYVEYRTIGSMLGHVEAMLCLYSSVLGHLEVFGAMLDHVQAMVGF